MVRYIYDIKNKYILFLEEFFNKHLCKRIYRNFFNIYSLKNVKILLQNKWLKGG